MADSVSKSCRYCLGSGVLRQRGGEPRACMHCQPAPPPRRYRRPDGSVVEVAAGFGKPLVFFAAVVNPNGSAKRVKSRHLPATLDRATAQQQLDLYAERKGWPAEPEIRSTKHE